MDTLKQKLIDSVRKHIAHTQEKIAAALVHVTESTNKTVREISSFRPEDQVAYYRIKALADKRKEDLTELYKSPYFIKCILKYDHSPDTITRYFAKFEMSEESIYSWVAPIATIRFEAPGQVSYKLPSGERRFVQLLEKEQYMIVDGKVIFFARETITEPRELIYQEHFSNRKTGFMLPEIVAQMEKAQDQVIRAHHKGPMVIAGPAGSGKTTLAFHRIAYLVQAPETAPLYPGRQIIVFVQDTGTKEYFGHLLPELGIKNVRITTFSEWALNTLDLTEYDYTIRYGSTDEQKDTLEYEKLKALRSGTLPKFNARPYTLLNTLYAPHFSEASAKLFAQQKKDNTLDRFDLTILLRAYIASTKKIKSRRDKSDINYSLALVDEFQNYLPEQLKIFKRCLHEDTQSMIYVGDMAQQVNLGTIRAWTDIDEVITSERQVLLKKVYRNTRSILSYINSLGYTVDIPADIKDGPAVTETILANTTEQIAHLKNEIEKNAGRMIGIIGRTHADIEPFKKALIIPESSTKQKNMHILTMAESQGVEFDIVYIVGIHAETFAMPHLLDTNPEHIAEKKRMQKDLLYVALTRAITELHIIGSAKLKDCITIS